MTIHEIPGSEILVSIGIITISATISAIIARVFRQPLILAYILAGIIIGPYGLQIIINEKIIETLAMLGMALLLFMVGLELNLNRLRDVTRVSIGCGLGQIIVTFVFGYLLATAMNFNSVHSFYIAFALTISSTMVVIKLLSDREELETLHGKIVLGTLLVQDITTIIVLSALPKIEMLNIDFFINSLVAGIGIVGMAIITNRYIAPIILNFITKSVELLLLFAISWCFIFSLIAAILKFSIAIGAFLAGVSLATSPYNVEIIARVRSLRDFFSTIFFVSLGMEVPLIPTLMWQALVFALFVLIGNVLIMMIITEFFGYGKRTAFLTGLSLAQISEFSLIIANEGLNLGHINQDIFSLIAFVAIISITGSTYFITHSDGIYRFMIPILNLFHMGRKTQILERIPKNIKDHVILFGCHRMGSIIAKTLQMSRKKFIVVDINPEIVKSLMRQNINTIYGDISDNEILERINIKDAKIVISTIPNKNDNIFLLSEVRRLNPSAIVFTTANHLNDALELYKNGADYVILPNMLGGEKISEILGYRINRSEIEKLKRRHILQLEDLMRMEFLLSQDNKSIMRCVCSLGDRINI
ncbi:MAG: hypothetical protein DRO90_01790 [Candidatus Altiarchaeales archaeon]|nr:MAG: hypothetical protein DRO95_03570 [Candidatus Altiarchaeales archaeon]RLI94591.1 MAG: hypothetical protein DRO90_01790 [Candidatus Altiarchaeales archaeon]